MPTTKYETRITQLTIAPECEAIFSEHAFTVSIEDLAAGEFLTVRGHNDGDGQLSIDKDEWEALRDAIDSMFQTIRP